MSVFVGGCTIEAVEAVAEEAGRDAPGSARRGLVDKSLGRRRHAGRGTVAVPHARNDPGVREEKLEESGEAGTCARASCSTGASSSCERAEPELTGPEQMLWFDRIDAEHSNIRASVSWGIDQSEALEAVTRLAGSLRRYRLEGGPVREGR